MLTFLAVIGLAITNKIQQKKLYLAQNSIGRAEGLELCRAYAAAAKACSEIDHRTAFIFYLFRMKYDGRYNLLMNDQEIAGKTGYDDETSAHFVRQLRYLIVDNGESGIDDR
jgi:hypothetical protein